MDSKFRTYWTGSFGPQEYSLGLVAWPELEICTGHVGSPAFLKTCRSERVHIGILKLFLWVCGEAVNIYDLQGVSLSFGLQDLSLQSRHSECIELRFWISRFTAQSILKRLT